MTASDVASIMCTAEGSGCRLLMRSRQHPGLHERRQLSRRHVVTPGPVPAAAYSSQALPRVRQSGLSLEVPIVLCVLAIGTLGTALPFLPGSGSSLLARLGLTQRWDMFAPDPSHSDGSLLVVARLADGSTVQLIQGTPDPLYSRWQKVSERARGIPAADIGPMFCRAMRVLEPTHETVHGLDLVYVDRTVRSAGAMPVVGERTLWSGSCA
jgi:hypothetical protein